NMSVDFSKNATERPEPCKEQPRGCFPYCCEFFHLDSYKANIYRKSGFFLICSLIHKGVTTGDGSAYLCWHRFLTPDTLPGTALPRICVSSLRYGDALFPVSISHSKPSNFLLFRAITFLNHTMPDFTDNGASNFIKYGNDYYATSETNYISKIDPVTLETLEKYLPVNLASCHPHYDKEGNAYNFGTSIATKGKTKYVLFKVPAVSDKGKKGPALKNVEVICSVPCRSLLMPSYYHSFGMTDNYIIFVEMPFKLDILKMATAYMRGVSWASCLKFCPEENTLIHLVDRKTGKEVETKYYTGAMVLYHHVNAFEDDGHVVFDVIAYTDNSLYDMFYLSNLKEKSQFDEKRFSKPNYKRFALPIHADKVSCGGNMVKLKYTTASAVKEKEGKFMCQAEVLCEGFELPRINYDINGKRHQFVYGNHVAKFDTETKKMVYWGEDKCLPSEPVFIPRPNGESEDDGVVLTSVINSNPGQSSFILILDGKTFKEVARAYVNTELNKDMHGFFIPH
uniref:Beta-carotene oxygenase 1 n=1 Tax=Neolamprologus brichardi TaxID=32507 RepID=A0A3Q4GSY5_NEOBR